MANKSSKIRRYHRSGYIGVFTSAGWLGLRLWLLRRCGSNRDAHTSLTYPSFGLGTTLFHDFEKAQAQFGLVILGEGPSKGDTAGKGTEKSP